jgi:hypothetical protein
VAFPDSLNIHWSSKVQVLVASCEGGVKASFLTFKRQCLFFRVCRFCCMCCIDRYHLDEIRSSVSSFAIAHFVCACFFLSLLLHSVLLDQTNTRDVVELVLVVLAMYTPHALFHSCGSVVVVVFPSPVCGAGVPVFAHVCEPLGSGGFQQRAL